MLDTTSQYIKLLLQDIGTVHIKLLQVIGCRYH